MEGLHGLEQQQHAYNLFSWQSFIAANWPRDAGGGADTEAKIGEGGDNLTVWEAWLQDTDLLVPPGDEPRAWANGPRPLPPACRGIAANDVSRVGHLTKAPDLESAFVEPGNLGPLINQNGDFTRYQISVNEPYYRYFRAQGLYSATDLSTNPKIDFPKSSMETNEIGAMSIKASWMPLSERYDASRFHVSTILVLNPNGSCEKTEVALVGLHIAHKTSQAPQWVWSTFEHVDNAPTTGQGARTAYNFNNPECAPAECPINRSMPKPWDPTKKATPTQVVRIKAIPDSLAELNTKMQALLRSVDDQSVWANYELVGTQRPRRPDAIDDPIGAPWPRFLENTTMETFIQGSAPPTASSCTGCHNRATSFTGEFSDYSYIVARVPPPN